jgi:transcriptional regulator with XRE-family HTH domain
VTTEKEEIFGKIIQEQRKAKKLSQEKLGKLTGLDRTAISLIETGKRSPIFITILKICSALKIKPSELLSLYEREDPNYNIVNGGKLGKF